MNDNFKYTYSAPTEEERREIESIKNQYMPKQQKEATLEKLKKLDAKVKNIPVCIALVLGIVGTLIFGLGLTLILEWNLVVWGVVVAVVGCVPSGLAYPIYNKTYNKLKQKYGAEIIKLSDDLLNQK